MQIMAGKEQNDLSDFEWGFNCDIVTKTLERYILFKVLIYLKIFFSIIVCFKSYNFLNLKRKASQFSGRKF